MLALEKLSGLTYAGLGTERSCARAIELAGNAVRLDPTLFDAHMILAWSLCREQRETEARHCFLQAIRLDWNPPYAMSMYADAMADWGYFAEAEALFRKALKKNDRCVVALRDFGRTLLRDDNADFEQNLRRAIALFERAVAADPEDAESHFRLGDALGCVDGETDRAIQHLQRALALKPGHANAAEALAEMEGSGGVESIGTE